MDERRRRGGEIGRAEREKKDGRMEAYQQVVQGEAHVLVGTSNQCRSQVRGQRGEGGHEWLCGVYVWCVCVWWVGVKG